MELHRTRSGERVYRASLPQGCVLPPTFFLLWSAPFVSAIRTLPGTTPLLLADVIPNFCSGNTIAVARRRAQLTAGTLVR